MALSTFSSIQSILLRSNPPVKPGSFLSNGSSTYATGLTSVNIESTTSSPFTIEFYFRVGALTYADQMLLSIGTYGQSSIEIKFLGGNYGTDQYKIGWVIFMRPQTLYTTTKVSANTWYHIAFVRTSGSTDGIVYLNGVAQATKDISTSNLITRNITVAGHFGGDGYSLGGNISNIRICQKAVYTGNFTVPSSRLRLTQSSGTNISAINSNECIYLLPCEPDNFLKDEATGVNLTNGGLTLGVSPSFF
jgi:hypothetical protein